MGGWMGGTPKNPQIIGIFGFPQENLYLLGFHLNNWKFEGKWVERAGSLPPASLPPWNRPKVPLLTNGPERSISIGFLIAPLMFF